MSQYVIASLLAISASSKILLPTFRLLNGSSNHQYVGIQDREGTLVEFKAANVDAFASIYPLAVIGDGNYHSVYELGSEGFLCVQTNREIVEIITWSNVEKRWEEQLQHTLPDFSSYLVRKVFDRNALSKTPRLGERLKGWRGAEYIGQRTIDAVWKKVNLPENPSPQPISEQAILAKYSDQYAMLRQLHSLTLLDELNDENLREWRTLFSYLWRTKYDIETMLSIASTQISKQRISSPLFQFIFNSVSGFLGHPSFQDAVSYILDEIEVEEESQENSERASISVSIKEKGKILNNHANNIYVLLCVLKNHLRIENLQNDYDINYILEYLLFKMNNIENEDRFFDPHSPEYMINRLIDYLPLIENEAELWKSSIENIFNCVEHARLSKEKRAFILRRLKQNISFSNIRLLAINAPEGAERAAFEQLVKAAST